MIKKKIVSKNFWWKLLLIVIGYLGVMLGVFFYALNRVKTDTKTASADTVSTSPYCLTYGTTTVDGETSAGCPDKFKVYMKSSRSSGSLTVERDYKTNWSQYYFIIDAVDVTEHLSLKLYKGSSVYQSISVSGEEDITVNFGALPSGFYMLVYECRYKKNFFTSNEYYTYEYEFEVDVTDPNYSISAGTGGSGYYTNKNIYYSADDLNFSHIRYRRGTETTFSYYYGRSYTVSATDANNGYWYFYAVDTVGNSSTIVSRYLDTIAPVGKVTNQDEDVIANGSATNMPFIYSATDARSVAKVEYKSPAVTTWTTYPGNVSILKSDGWYYFRATDEAGNVSDEYRVYYDTTKPLGAVFDSVQARGSGYITNKSYVKYTASDSGSGVGSVYVKKPGSSAFVSYTNGSQLTAEGKYYFKAYDKAGNITSTTHEIILDLTAPVGKLKANGVNVSNNSYTSKSFSYSATDAVGVAILQMKRPNSTNWETYTAGTDITGAEGWYSFRATDLAGNVSAESKIFYDVSKPTVTLISSNIGVGGTVVNSGAVVTSECIRATAVDTGSGVKAIYVSRNGGVYSLYTAGTELTAEGEYAFYAINNASVRSATVYLTLDKTGPTGIIYCENTKWNGTLSVTGADYIRFAAEDSLSGVKACYVLTPGATQYVECNSATEFTDEGKYIFYAIDLGNNASPMYSITINHTAPKGNLYINGELALDNNGYTNGEYISFIFNEGRGYVIPPNTASSQYTSGTTYSVEGKYAFWAENEGGQAGCVIVIDRTPKALTLTGVSNGYAKGEVEISWVDGNPDEDAPVDTITINGKLYEGGTIYTIKDAVYEVVCKDKAGNEWTTQFIGGQNNIPTITVQREFWEVKDGWSDTVYSFYSYDNALMYATTAEKRFVEYKTWDTAEWDQGVQMDQKDSVNAKNGTYYIYKSENDAEKFVAYFTEERLSEVVKKYAEKTIEAWYYWEKTPETCLDGDLNAYPNENKIVGTVVELREGLIYTLDGEPYAELTITAPGAHTLLIEDDYGGSSEYEIYILNSAPTIQYALGNNSVTTADFGRTYYFANKVTISIPFEGDDFAMFTVFDVHGEVIGYFNLEDTYTIEESGEYTVKAVNHFGETKAFTMIISLDAPNVAITENTEGKKLEITITKSVDKESSLQTLEIFKSVDGGETWELLERDDYGHLITTERLDYAFRTTAMYKVVVTDEFRTGIDAIISQADYEQKFPEGELIGVENGGVTNGSVSFEWTDEATVVLTKDGEAITYFSGHKLTVDGNYVLTFENFDGYKATYTFTIDTVAPEITTEGANHREAVNEDVKVFYTEENLTAELYKDGKMLGNYVSGNPISADGQYRVRVYDVAGNEVSVEFTIDKTVSYDINVYDKGLSNSVVATSHEILTTQLTKNGEKVDYALGSAITAIGDYTLVLTDALGNNEVITFRIINPLVQEFTHNFDDIEGFGGVLVNGADKRLNYGTLELFEDGNYEVGVIVGGKTYNFAVTVDGTAPALTLNGVENGGETKESVTLSDLSEKAMMKVYLNDTEIEYELGQELTELGKYRVVLTDEAGNVAEYEFEILYKMNGGAIALIVIGVLVILGIILAIILGKKATYKKQAVQEEDEDDEDDFEDENSDENGTEAGASEEVETP